MDYQLVIDKILTEVESLRGVGKQATYIPALENVNPDQMGICIETTGNERFVGGESDVRFSVQSISKVFALAMALGIEGEDVWKRVGREPSGTPFNSLIQLEVEKGKPRNPFIRGHLFQCPPKGKETP